MTGASDPATVAAGLTEAQRRALVTGKWNIMAISKGLIEIGIVRRFAQYMVELTPLGLAVRHELERNAP